MAYDDTDRATLARTLKALAPGSEAAAVAIAWVARARAESAYYAGALVEQAGAVAHVLRDDPAGIEQFPCWAPAAEASTEAIALEDCAAELAIAAAVLSGETTDPTARADVFCAADEADDLEGFMRQRTADIGGFVFFNSNV